MTQIIVTLEENTPPTIIKKAISLLKGVANVVVHNSPDHAIAEKQEMEDIAPEIRSLIGIASNIQGDDIASDEKLAHILNK